MQVTNIGEWGRRIMLALGAAVLLLAQAFGADANPRDVLVYKDGDRVHGTLLRREGDTIVFRSDRFGEVRVAASDAVVIKGEPPPTPLVPTTPAAPGAGVAAKVPGTTPPAAVAKSAARAADTRTEEERLRLWEWFYPSVLTAKVREFFGPWHGRLAVSTEVVQDTANRRSHSLDGTLRRKWERDEVQLNGHYDFAKTDDLTTTDTIRGSGSWRHDFNKRIFAQYRPSAEWNRASLLNGVPNDYLLLQQEIGAGVSIITTPTRKVRAGVSQNLFDVWNSAPAPAASHSSRGAQSLFEEVELTLPWRMGLSQRAVWYPLPHHTDGWENRIELSKKLTETLSTSLRHEIRRHNPDGTSQDYTRLKLLIGLDF